MFDPMYNLKKNITGNQQRIEEVQEQMAESKRQEIERQNKHNELLEMNVAQNKEMIDLQNAELDFLRNIDGNTAALVGLLTELEVVNKEVGEITEEDMLVIKNQLDQIIKNTNTENKSQEILKEAKKQILDKGISFGIQFIITGIKLLFKADQVS